MHLALKPERNVLSKIPRIMIPAHLILKNEVKVVHLQVTVEDQEEALLDLVSRAIYRLLPKLRCVSVVDEHSYVRLHSLANSLREIVYRDISAIPDRSKLRRLTTTEGVVITTTVSAHCSCALCLALSPQRRFEKGGGD